MSSYNREAYATFEALNGARKSLEWTRERHRKEDEARAETIREKLDAIEAAERQVIALMEFNGLRQVRHNDDLFSVETDEGTPQLLVVRCPEILTAWNLKTPPVEAETAELEPVATMAEADDFDGVQVMSGEGAPR